MAEATHAPPPPPQVPPARPPRPRWPIVLVVVAALLLLAGLALALFEPEPPPKTAGAMGANLTDGGTTAAEESWAPGFLKMGFSFFVCFAMGYAARKFLKVGLVVSGILFALLFAASHFGYLQVNWHVLGDDFDRMVGGLRDQFDSVKKFVTGSLPAAGMGALGLLAGFKSG